MHRKIALVTTFLLLLVFTHTLFAQVTTVSLEGKAVDNESKPLPSANVVLKNEETGYVRGTATDINGQYRILGIPSGIYTVEVRLVGYRPVKRENVQFITGQRPVMDFTLTPEAVEVSGVEVLGVRAEQFELRRLDVSTAVVRDQILNLPLNSRSLMNLAAVAPGIRSFAPSAGRSLPAAGSLPELRFINLYVDGAEWKSLFNGNVVGIPQTGSPLPQEAIQEFRTILSPFDAEYTRGGSYVISAITRRGTNQYRAEAFSFFRDKSLNSRGPFEKAKPDFNRQQAGVTLSGPLVQDKLFVLGSYEIHKANDFIDVVPGRPSYNPGLWDKYKGTFEAPNKNQTGVIRLTYQQSSDHTFDYIWATRYLSSKTFFGGTAAEPAGIYGQYHINSHMVKHSWIVSSKSVNELSLQYLRWRHYEPTINTGPAYVYPNITLGRGTFPIRVAEDHYRLINKFTTVVDDFYGPHIIKTGFEIARVSMTPWFPSYLYGQFENFLTDTSALPRRALIGVGALHPLDPTGMDAETDDKGTLVGVYIQDQWNPLPQLTLNLGLRYDVEINTLNNSQRLPWADSTALTSALSADWINKGDRENDVNNIAPRFSFNYDAFGTGQTILRGGYGLTFDRTAYFIAYNERRDAFWRTYVFTNPGTTDPAVLRQRVASGSVTGVPSINLLNKKMATPQVHQFSFGIGHQVSNEIGINVDYVNSHANALYAAVNANYVSSSLGRRVLATSFGDINLWGSRATAFNHGFLTNIVYRTPSTRLSLSHTLSWAYSDQDALSAWPDPNSIRRQRSNTDERHRFVFSGIVGLPYEFQVSWFATLASPRPFDVTDGRDLNGNGQRFDDWPNGERNQLPDVNSIRFWYKMIDLRASKAFDVASVRIEAIFETFNLFNWFNASGYSGNMRDASGNPNLNFGKPTGAFAPRQMQLGLRVSY